MPTRSAPLTATLLARTFAPWADVVARRLARGRKRTGEKGIGAKGIGAPLVAVETTGQPVWTPRDYAAFAREGMMSNAIVYRSVRMIAEAAASIPLILYQGDGEITDHPFLDLLARPAPGMTGTDMLEAWYGFLLVSGNAYLEAASLGGDIRELHVLRPDRMRVIPGADGWPEAWEYQAGSTPVRISGEAAPGVARILQCKLFHPANDHYGLSPIEAAAAAIDLHNAAARWNKALLDNSARPSGALVYTTGGTLTGDQFERLKAELETTFQGARNAGRPLLLEGGLDWKAMSLSPRDMDFLEAKHAAAREIALAIGVPPMLLGIPGDNTYANLAEANRAFWRQAVLPLVNRTARALSLWLAPAWGGDLRLVPDLDQVEALAPERDALWTRLENASFLTDAEKRTAAGYDAKGGVGVDATHPFDGKFNRYHDERGRFTFAPDGGEDAPVIPAAGRGGFGRWFGGPPKPPASTPPTSKPSPPSTSPPVPPGKTIRNKDLAGKTHPETGIPFDKDGFPDFSGVAKSTVTVPHTGTAADAVAANKAAGLSATPPDMVWHHHQDGYTMQLVPKDVHSQTGHTGSRGLGVFPGKR